MYASTTCVTHLPTNIHLHPLLAPLPFHKHPSPSYYAAKLQVEVEDLQEKLAFGGGGVTQSSKRNWLCR